MGKLTQRELLNEIAWRALMKSAGATLAKGAYKTTRGVVKGAYGTAAGAAKLGYKAGELAASAVGPDVAKMYRGITSPVRAVAGLADKGIRGAGRLADKGVVAAAKPAYNIVTDKNRDPIAYLQNELKTRYSDKFYNVKNIQQVQTNDNDKTRVVLSFNAKRSGGVFDPSQQSQTESEPTPQFASQYSPSATVLPAAMQLRDSYEIKISAFLELLEQTDAQGRETFYATLFKKQGVFNSAVITDANGVEITSRRPRSTPAAKPAEPPAAQPNPQPTEPEPTPSEPPAAQPNPQPTEPEPTPSEPPAPTAATSPEKSEEPAAASQEKISNRDFGDLNKISNEFENLNDYKDVVSKIGEYKNKLKELLTTKAIDDEGKQYLSRALNKMADVLKSKSNNPYQRPIDNQQWYDVKKLAKDNGIFLEKSHRYVTHQLKILAESLNS